MAEIKYTVTLDDKYTAKAKSIAQSTDAMGDAMKKSQSIASKMGSALDGAFSKMKSSANQINGAMKSAFDRSHKVRISEIGSKETRSRIYKLNNDLKSVTGKPLNFHITAKTSRLDHVKNQISKMKSGVDSISNSFNKKLDGGFSKFSKFTSDMSAFHKAKKEARDLSRELTRVTGQRHKIKIDMENPVKGFFSNMKSSVSNMFSKMNPKNWFGGRSAMPAPEMGEGGGNLLGSIVKGNLITGAISKGIGALKSGMDTVFGAGMTRLENIQASKARLKGFGHDEKTVNTISQNAMEAVSGTAYGFGDAMTASANAVAAGIKPGEDLTKHLKLIGNAAAATGADFNEMGSIFNKVKTTGYLQGDEARQIMDRGIALLPALADTMGESIDSVRQKMSKGEISFDDFSKAMESASGNVAEEMANTFSGAKDNLKAALGRIGANLLGGSDNESGLFGGMVPMIKGVTEGLKQLEPIAKNVGDKLGDFAGGALEKAKAGFGKVSDFLQPAMDKFSEGFAKASEKIGQLVDPLKEKFATAFDGLKEAFAPVIEAISGLFGDTMGSGMDVFTVMIDLVGQALSFLADTIITVTPIIQSVAEWISANIIPAISEVVSWVSGSLIPAISEVVSTVLGVLIPIFQTVSDFIGSYVVPAFETIANTILSVAEPVFHAIASAVEWATSKFNDLVGAVGAAADALFSLPGKIAGMVGDAVGGAVSSVKKFLGIGKHATGTEYFGGGMTQINERGEEMIQLARGDKIYPAGKTEKIIKNEVKNTKSIDRSVSSPSITINVNGANMTNKDVANAISAEFKRLGVLV